MHHGVDRADITRRGVDLVEEGHDRLLVGDGHAEAEQVRAAELPDALGQPIRLDWPGLVGGVNAEVVEGGLLEGGRRGVAQGVADDAETQGHRVVRWASR